MTQSNFSQSTNYNYSPILYFPTTALFLDDNINYLRSIPLLLKENIPYILEENPTTALDIINNVPSLFNLNDFFSHDLNNIDTRSQHMKMSLNILYKTMYNNNRYNNISVIIVDYAMPQLNGLEFCSKITNPHVKKIMLTGIADQNVAVTAFNQGIIDKFFMKNQYDFNDINTAIYQLQLDYFNQLFKPIIDILSLTISDYIFKENGFIEIFQHYCQNNNIIEYYLFKETGSCILMDPDGKLSYLYVYTADDLETFYEIAKDNNLDNTLLQTIQTKTYIPCVPININLLKLPIKAWGKYLVKASHFKGTQDYYYSFIKDNSNLYLEKQILSFNEYMRKKFEPIK